MLIIIFKFVVCNCSAVDHQSYIVVDHPLILLLIISFTFVVDHQCDIVVDHYTDIVVDGNSRELAAMRLCASQTGLGRNGIHRKSIN